MAYLEFLRGHYNTGLKGYYETRDRLAALLRLMQRRPVLASA